MASTTRGSIGVVACASKYNGFAIALFDVVDAVDDDDAADADIARQLLRKNNERIIVATTSKSEKQHAHCG
jgi:hypothetical protein